MSHPPKRSIDTRLARHRARAPGRKGIDRYSGSDFVIGNYARQLETESIDTGKNQPFSPAATGQTVPSCRSRCGERCENRNTAGGGRLWDNPTAVLQNPTYTQAYNIICFFIYFYICATTGCWKFQHRLLAPPLHRPSKAGINSSLFQVVTLLPRHDLRLARSLLHQE